MPITTTKTVSVDAYVFDVLMRDLVGHDHSPSSFLVFLHLWRETHGRRVDAVQLSLQQIATSTGLSKSAVQTAFRILKRRRLLRSVKAHDTDVPTHTLKKSWG
jgi:hypothetical protein